MADERIARVFKNGRSQAIRIPKDFELSCDRVVIRKEDGRLVIEESPNAALLEHLATLEPIDEDIGPIDDPPAEPVEL